MQALTSTTVSGTKLASVSRSPVLAARPSVSVSTVCQAQQKTELKRAPLAAAAASVTSVIAANPALALVDDRLGGEGTGKILGVSGIEGWAIIGVFTLVWALYYAAQKDLGGDKTDDSGMSL